MMKVYSINYVLKNGQVRNVGILANSREEAVRTLHDKQKGVHQIPSINIGLDVHVISDEIKNNVVNGTPQVKKYKQEIQKLKNFLMDSDDIIEELRNKEVVVPVVSKTDDAVIEKMIALETELELLKSQKPQTVDTSKYDTKIKTLEEENKKLIELQKSNLQRDTSDMLKLITENEELKKQLSEIEKDIFICPHCEKEYKTQLGLTNHIKKEHKE